MFHIPDRPCTASICTISAILYQNAAQPGHAADGALRPQDRCFLKIRIGLTARSIYRCAAADAQTVGPYLFISQGNANPKSATIPYNGQDCQGVLTHLLRRMRCLSQVTP